MVRAPSESVTKWRQQSPAHTFRATGMTAYLGNAGGVFEHTQLAAHEVPET
jgi:hypothetical protein